MITARSVFSLHSFHDPFFVFFWLYWTLPAAFYMQRRFRAIHKKPHIKNCQYNKKDFTYFMLYHCTSPDSFLFHTYTIQSQSQFNLNKIYFSCVISSVMIRYGVINQQYFFSFIYHTDINFFSYLYKHQDKVPEG